MRLLTSGYPDAGWRRCALLGLVALIGNGTTPASAAEAGGQPMGGPHPGIECTCRANGRSYPMGERVCLQTPAGYRVAECRMAQNVTSWVFGPEDCAVSASLLPGVER